MSNLFFWKNWYRNDRHFFQAFLLTTVLSLLYLGYCLLTGVDNVIHWNLLDNLDRIKTTIDTFELGNIKFDIQLDNFIIFQYFEGSNLNINPIHGYIYLIFLVLMINLIMSILPSLSKFWFYAGMGVFIGFMVLMNLSQIELFNQTDQSALIITLSLYLIAGYYFREFNPYLSLGKRYLIFTLISILLGILFYFYTGVDRPFLYIANYGFYGPVLITVLFILSIAHEILYGFLYLITGNNTPSSKNSLPHFIILSLIYFFYVAITYLYYTRQLDWNLVYLNPFLVFILAAIIGLWSFRKREVIYSEIFSFNPEGALFYTGFATISIMTISYAFATGNDPMIEAFEDAILFSQLGFGFIFFIYIVANFGVLLARDYRVARIVYQSRIFPFFIFRIGGVIATGFIFFQSGFFSYYQTIAGYYNNIGDLFLIEKQLNLAEQYYQKASDYEFQNHRSNYAMATLAGMKNEKIKEVYSLENALLKRPTEYAYINLANIYMENDQYFEGLFKLRDGREEFPYSHQILNNLGYFYSRTDVTDSAFYFFNLSSNAARKPEVPVANIYATLVKDRIYISPDSIREYYKPGSDRGARINVMALNNQIGQHEQDLKVTFPDSIQDNEDFAYLYNVGLNLQKSQDTSYFNVLEGLVSGSNDEFYRNRLNMNIALHHHFVHKNTSAIRTLKRLGTISLYDDEYFRILGKLALKMGSPRLAIDFFRNTNMNNEKDRFNLAIAMLESGNREEARGIFYELTQNDDPDLVQVASEYLDVLTFTPEKDLSELSDEFKYLLFRHHPRFRDVIHFNQILEEINNEEIKLLIHTEYIKRLIERGEVVRAHSRYDSLMRSEIIENNERTGLKIRELGYLLSYDLPDSVTVQVDDRELPLNHPLYLHGLLYRSLKKIHPDDTARMEESFRILGTWNPFFTYGIVHAVDYYYQDQNEEYTAYNLLLEALDINPYSVMLNKKFVLLCVNMNLWDYAVEGLLKLKDLMDPDEYNTFRDTVEKRLEQQEKDMEAWF